MGGAQRSGVRSAAASEPPVARIVFHSFGKLPHWTGSHLGDPDGAAHKSAGRYPAAPPERFGATGRCRGFGRRSWATGPSPVDLRSTFASNALAAGITTFELARIMGTSVGMIEAHHGALIDTAPESILSRLETLRHAGDTDAMANS